MSDNSLVEWVSEALDAEGALSARKMFGGLALYLDGRIFAMIADAILWFKCDAVSNPIWEAEGCSLFTYDFGDGKMAGTMNYRRAPDEVYDDAEAMRRWAELGLAAALRAPQKKPKVPKIKPRAK